jgi:F420-dependent oxidoreductase-like protein
MRLGLQLGYDDPVMYVGLAEEADRCGFHSVWTSEAWGSDAVSPLAWIGGRTTNVKLGTGIMQMPARTPATTAATVATLDLLSGGRVLLGLGTSGPQVVEGWHGQPFGKPLRRTREYVSIVRTILRRREPLEHHGEHYDIPYGGDGSTGLGKPLKLMARPLRAEIPIYLAVFKPRSVELAAEIADGWLPIFFSPEKSSRVFPAPFERDDLDIAPSVPALLSDDVETARDALKGYYALYIGGMGARGKNFYNDLACEYGFEGAAERIQDLYLDGKQRDAAAAVPDELVDELALVGPKERIADRLAAWRESGATTLLISTRDAATLRAVVEAM